MERIIDVKIAGSEGSEFIRNLAEEMKEKYRSMILQKAAEARLKDDK